MLPDDLDHAVRWRSGWKKSQIFSIAVDQIDESGVVDCMVNILGNIFSRTFAKLALLKQKNRRERRTIDPRVMRS
jgi:hypothetical protein